MKCVFQFSLRVLNKNHSYFLMLLNAVPNLHLVYTSHKLDLLIPFIIDFELYIFRLKVVLNEVYVQFCIFFFFYFYNMMFFLRNLAES